MFAVLYFIHLVTLADDIDNYNLISPYHYPSGKNSTLLSQGLIGGRKKRIIGLVGPHGFQPRSGLSVQRGSTTNTYCLDHSSVPTEKCRFFCLGLPASHTP
jgi:hypothetical protein